jgi:hypothetical protein
MDAWVRNLVMLGVLAVWGAFMLVSMFVLEQVPSPFVWTVPGATYTVLVGRVPISWQRTPPPNESGDRQPERRQES